MAYIKYKELTQYFNFYKELDINNLPNYVLEYIDSDEKILIAYETIRDKFVLTEHKIILFDVRGVLGKNKRIHFFPVASISSAALDFKPKKMSLLLSLDSGYQLRLNFVNMNPNDKVKMRMFFTNVINKKSFVNSNINFKNKDFSTT
ncbi:MAG: PH domain-containing protein [Clostridium sp.]|nr:PH domain-containing protein [Clostridium sp.]MCM1444297.1 PH domain-containing protein [Candidatus Amulumruptor caecigallinarius]